MQINTNGQRNITLDFDAPKKFKLKKDGAEIPYIRTGKNSFRLGRNIDGVLDLEEVIEQPRIVKPMQLQAQQMAVINPQDVDRLNEAVRQMALVNPQDVMIINQTAEQLEKNQNFIAQTQKEITDNQVYIDQQQQRLNETALGIQALETDNSQRLDGTENAILNLAGEISNAQNMAVDGMNTALNKIEEQGILLQAEIDTKADKDELESLKKDFEEKSDRISSAMANYSGGTAYDTLPQGGEAGQILAKRTDRQGDYIWIDQTPVIVKSKTIPTASEKYKGEVYQYVGETGDYTHGYIYECQQNGTSYNWVRIDVQPNTAVWGQITGTLSDQTDLQEALDDKQDKLSQTQLDAVNSGANSTNIAQITTNQNNINSINDKIPAQATSTNQLADKDYVDTADNDLQTAINGKQDTLVSGTNIKTINGSSVLGSGDLSVTAQIAWGSITGTLSNQTDLQNALNAKQDVASAVNYDNISNCITEIPQDIKLELNNGTLTLKAGSKVYVPNGAGVFNKVTISSDFSVTSTANSQEFILLSPGRTSITHFNKNLCSSGPTQPTVTTTYWMWYDTTNNKIKYTTNSGVSWIEGFSLPLGLSTTTSSGIQSIDQIFNGFGYIGSTIFVLPGVKGLIPNGRNADGTLKNIEFVTDKVIIRTITWNNSAGQELFIGKYTIDGNIQFTSTSRIGQYYQQEDEPSLIKYAMWYKPSENKMYRCDNSGGNLIWKNCFPCYLGQWFTSATSPYPITELTTKLSFRAVDYNDLTTITTNSNARNIGEIITSSIPLNDAGLHLLDGSLIQGNGIYSEFYDFMVEKWQTYPQIFAVEQDWQNHVATYGVCGKFVLDEANRTIRLPLITGFIEGTNTLADLEKFTQAGLPNITGSLRLSTTGFPTATYDPVGAFGKENTPTNGFFNLSKDTTTRFTTLTLNASNSNSIYGNSSTVQPQSIKVLRYICIATSTKTDIQVDIDEIATDLNGKADTDLSNCTKPYITETYVNGTSWYRVYSDGWCEQGGGDITTSGNVNFLKPFINTNYCLVGSIGHGDKSQTWEHYDLRKESTNYFYQNCCFDGYRLVSWYACGYIS